jgi:hypothetical protein
MSVSTNSLQVCRKAAGFDTLVVCPITLLWWCLYSNSTFVVSFGFFHIGSCRLREQRQFCLLLLHLYTSHFIVLPLWLSISSTTLKASGMGQCSCLIFHLHRKVLISSPLILLQVFVDVIYQLDEIPLDCSFDECLMSIMSGCWILPNPDFSPIDMIICMFSWSAEECDQNTNGHSSVEPALCILDKNNIF